MKEISRRQFAIASIGLVAVGCTESRRIVHRRLPPPIDPPTRLRSYDPPSTLPPRSQPQVQVPTATQPLKAIARSQWTTAKPIKARLRPLQSVKRITVHHEGWKPVWFDDVRTTAARLERIRKSHLERLHAGDIGYHLIIDRAGRVWQGRDLRYQGAHVRNHNVNNLGIMVLGNFELQRPTEVQQNALRHALLILMRHNRVPTNQVFTHQELNVTSCPGKALQAHMVSLRRNGRLA